MDLDWIQWGDAPTWFGSVAGAVALGFTAFTVRQQTKQLAAQQKINEETLENLRLERKTLQSEVRDRHTAQARQVKFTFELVPGDDFPDGPESCWYVAHVTNSSDEAIINLTVDYQGLEEPQAVRMKPDGGLMDQPCTAGPGHEVVFSSQHTYMGRLDQIYPRCLFTDAAGVDWVLDQDGRLVEDTPPTGSGESSE
ncbi:hypothetical protein [Streptomyces sp. VNUA74]|uniref:hypothetical protein n=1 Tax=Streptomyces sp. VNUA74 TaxID=3062685 RepID=UPI00280A4EB7|nr:hypothetical protein [Streptomyces sp. VNUA74]WML79196.1 hypothetical protein Q3101_04785 [Streptomyces sp. VNUA74]